MIAIEIEQAIERVRQAMDGHLRHHFAEVRGPVVNAAAAYEHEILRHGTWTELAKAASEADGCDVVLTAAVRPPADLDVTGRHEIDELRAGAEMFCQCATEPPRLCHREAAALGARAP